MSKKFRYDKTLARKMYAFFSTYQDTQGAPSFSKFARRVGATLEDIELCRRHAEFERAYRECNEIRKDYLIDAALTKRYDSSFTKYLLSAEYAVQDSDDGSLDFTLEVLPDRMQKDGQ